MSTFWVNPDGLSSGGNSLGEVADAVSNVSSDFQNGVTPQYESLGTGPDVNTFKATFGPGLDNLVSGLNSLSQSVRETSQGLLNMAQMFRDTEENNLSVSRQLLAGESPSGES